MRVLAEPHAPQPELPPAMPGGDPWPAETLAWWQMWGESALADTFTAVDWSCLVDTAGVHALMWTGKASAAAELRLRVALFGATPADRARLRITFATAEEADPSISRSRPPGGNYPRLVDAPAET